MGKDRGQTCCTCTSSRTTLNCTTTLGESFALPAPRRLRAENPTLGVTCWSATPTSPCACVIGAAPVVESRVRARGASRRGASCRGFFGGPGAAGGLGGPRREKARVGFGSAARYAAIPPSGEGRGGDGGGDGGGWAGQGRAVRPAAREWGPRLPLPCALPALLSPEPGPGPAPLPPAPLPPARCPRSRRLGVSH